MPIYLGVGGAVKQAATPFVGVGGAVKNVRYGKCGIGGAVKTFYDYMSVIDHVEFDWYGYIFKQFNVSETGVTGTSKSTLAQYVNFEFKGPYTNSSIPDALRDVTHYGVFYSFTYRSTYRYVYVRYNSYIVLKNGLRLPFNMPYAQDGKSTSLTISISDSDDESMWVVPFGHGGNYVYSRRGREFIMGQDDSGSAATGYIRGDNEYRTYQTVYFLYATINGVNYPVVMRDIMTA